LSAGIVSDTDDDFSLADAKVWLLDALNDGAWIWHRDVLKMAKDQGYSKRTIDRAKKDLNIPSVKLGIGEKQKWYWTMDKDTGQKPSIP